MVLDGFGGTGNILRHANILKVPKEHDIVVAVSTFEFAEELLDCVDGVQELETSCK